MDQNKIGIIKLILNINSTNYNLNNWTLYTQHIYIKQEHVNFREKQRRKEGKKERKEEVTSKRGGEGMSEREK